ncbi:MAG TPA: nitronate monooxygenase [Nocardioides sp.]|nr:nitronate monooxygenase [Nocardioides sp.]
MLDLRELSLPIIGAPMAGGPGTPALAAAVSDAGGLGFVATGYKSPEAVAADLEAVRALTTGPFGVNLFVVEPYQPDTRALDAYRRSLEPLAARFDVDLGEPRWEDDAWRAKLELVYDARPDVVTFTFGCPSDRVLRQLADLEVHSGVTVTTVAEAREAVARGAASLAVQGPGAGGHRGSWQLDEVPDETPLLDLVSAVRAAVDVPLVAGGGIHDAQGVRSAMDAGAAAALVGTAYLLADEAGTNPTHRAALQDPGLAETALTRAYTGRWARGLANDFIRAHQGAPAGYPHLHHLTAPLRKAAAAAGDPQVAHLWAGSGQAHARQATAAEITRALAS